MQVLLTVVVNLVLTLIIELTISLFIGISKKDIKKIAFINVLTNVPLNIIISIFLRPILPNYGFILYTIIIILEIIIVIVEGNYFKRLDNPIINIFKLSIILNAFSYSYGLIYKLLLTIFA